MERTEGRQSSRAMRWAKSILSTAGSIFVLVSFCFLIMHAIPGDPFQDEQGIPEEIVQQLKARWGLDKPLYEQYVKYVSRVFQGDLGVSIRYPSQTVLGIIMQGFPISAFLGVQAILFALPIGTLLGTLWACRITSIQRARKNIPFDMGLSLFSSLVISMPNFVIAALFQLFFALWIPLFPVARWGTYDHSILPSIALAIGPTAMIIRLAKARAQDIFLQEWVTMARMKGLSERRVITRHVLPHVMLPVLSYLGPVMTNLLVGSFAIERVYGIPGLGQWFVNSILTRDYPVIAGLTLFYSIILFSCHHVVDLLSFCIDGRRHGKHARHSVEDAGETKEEQTAAHEQEEEVLFLG